MFFLAYIFFMTVFWKLVATDGTPTIGFYKFWIHGYPIVDSWNIQ